MRIGVVSELVRTVSRFAIVGLVGGMAAACSSDTTRFSGSPFSNPFSASAEADPHETGSVSAGAPAAIAPMPRSSVQSVPLAAPSGQVGASAPMTGRPVSASRTASGRMVAGWRLEGGTPVTVGPGETVETISGRYGVPANAILSANNLSAAQVVPGRQVIIPVYTVARAPAPAPVPVAAAPVGDGRVLTRGKLADARAPRPESLQPRSLGEQAADARLGHARRELPVVRDRSARLAAAEPRPVPAAEPKGHVRPGRPVAGQPLPVKTAEHKPAAEAPLVGKVTKSEKLAVVKDKPAKPAKAEQVADAKPARPVGKVAAAEPARIAAPEPVKAAPAPAKEVESTASLPAVPASSSGDFRWPAKGRVISGFGSGGSNEGINIAVPDGTPVKAAESGTVAYAGSEVKGYGNLVLIRHDNGYVSAYAHNGELDVKRGQRVTRGQLIAKSGQSGNVTSPQLHFEIRKGATPVDPMPYLASN